MRVFGQQLPVLTKRAQKNASFSGTAQNCELVEEPVTRAPPHLEPIVPNSGNGLRTKPFARLQPSYPLQLCVRRSIGLCCTHDVSPPRLVSPRGLPSTNITWLQWYYAPSDFLTAVSMSSLLHLFIDTPFPGRTVRTSHVRLSTFDACRALRPRGCHTLLPIPATCDVAFW
jgi:hypothetical protein